MYIHIGNGMAVRSRCIVGIFDIDYCSVDKRTREYLTRAQKEGRVVDVSQELPKSFIVTSAADGRKVYITNVSPATLAKRAASKSAFGGLIRQEKV
ncbi:MAG: DUF370 domain-containing protein [Oscillospiraceae bacterium]|nr:DUF370 domain-containing protein [Oscillospiraceae bacterium]MBQ9959729.1 DUF370 domain-containing protein [Oscillospiraceae bacterium]